MSGKYNALYTKAYKIALRQGARATSKEIILYQKNTIPYEKLHTAQIRWYMCCWNLNE